MARVRRKLRREKYDDAQYILVGVLNAVPEEAILPEIYTSLAETEYHRCHFRNSMHYARLATDALEASPSRLEPLEVQALLRKMQDFVDLGREGMRRARLEFVANPVVDTAVDSIVDSSEP